MNAKLADWPGSCFGCSPTNPHGLHLRFCHKEQGCVTSYIVSNSMCGFDGMAHGGIIALLLDEASAWALIAHLGKLGATREMTIRYLKPVPTNEELTVEGLVINNDEKSAQVRSRILDCDGAVLAEGESSWAFMKLSRIAALAGVDVETYRNFLETCRSSSSN